jgi:alpha-galactosidase
MCEYLSYTHDPVTKPWEKYGLRLQSWDGNRKRRAERKALAAAIAAGERSVDELRDLHRFNILHEPVPEIVAAVHYNERYYSEQLNIPNNGLIPNLPDDAIVEVPGFLSGMGIQGLAFPPLPKGIAELCRRELVRSSLSVEAAAKGDKDLALQALLLDPMVSDIDTARAILNDFLIEFAEYLPQFARDKEFVV